MTENTPLHFTLTRGLRGCYMPDDAWIVTVKRASDLAEIAIAEIEMREDAEGEASEGCADAQDAAEWAGAVWNMRGALEIVLPLGDGYGLGASPATAEEADAYAAEIEDYGP